ncbi:MAG: hypothetical protein IJ365_04020 [Clostridia bacterium]|nr:hypothetical protein [Clostridia bacterium]
MENDVDICLALDMHPEVEKSIIDGVPRIAVTYGPMLLALDSHFGNSIWETTLLREKDLQLERIDNPSAHNMEFVCDGVINGERAAVHLVDYCSAAKGSPDDEFLVWIAIGGLSEPA